MQVVYAYQSLKQLDEMPSVFLVGPTPRSPAVKSWRPKAQKLLNDLGFAGIVIVPEPEDANWKGDYLNQIEWEREGLEKATVIAAWVPRDLETLPGFTTNVEFGRYVSSGRLIYGRNGASQFGRPNANVFEINEMTFMERQETIPLFIVYCAFHKCHSYILVEVTLFRLPLPLNLGHFPHQIPNLVAVKFGDRRNAVDVLDEVFRCAQGRQSNAPKTKYLDWLYSKETGLEPHQTLESLLTQVVQVIKRLREENERPGERSK